MKKEERVIYICGPITGLINENREAFRKVADELKSHGLIVRNPHDICADLPKGSSWATYMRKCIISLMECTDLITLDAWDLSKGATMEVKLAMNLGIQVSFTVKDLLHKIEAQRKITEALEEDGNLTPDLCQSSRNINTLKRSQIVIHTAFTKKS